MKEVVVVSAARTPFGKFGGMLKDISVAELGGMAIREALARAGIEKEKLTEAIGRAYAATENRLEQS